MIQNIEQESKTQFTLNPISTISSLSDAHRHNFYVLIYIKEGAGKQYVDSEEIQILPNHLYFIDSNKVHIHHWDTTCNGYIMKISPDYLTNELNLLNQLFKDLKNVIYFHIPNDEQEDIDNLVNLLVKKYHDEKITSALVRMILTTFLYYCLDIKKTYKKDNHIYLDNRLLRIYELIEKEFKQNHNIDFYAKQLSLSVQYLNRLVKHHTGKTLAQLIRTRKIIEAKRELIFTDKTINNISENLGFFDNSNFSKYFKNETSYSPTSFRKKFKIYQ